MIPETPSEWLNYLTDRLDKRNPELSRLNAYAVGEAPLPTGATKHRDAYRDFQKKARTNFAELIVDAVADRMSIAGFRVDGQAGDNDAARALWRRSLMESGANDVHRDMLTYGVGYAMASLGDTGALLTRESPFGCITDHDPVNPTIVRAALKTWTDVDRSFAVLHLPGEIHYFTRHDAFTNSRTAAYWPDTPPVLFSASGDWQEVGSAASGLDVVPVMRFGNRDMVGEFANHTDLLDRINWTILQRLLIIAMQAFRQRGIRGDLPETDETGAPIDYSSLFAPGPDALWMLPEGVDVWESLPGDITQILTAVKDDIRDLSAVTRTPMSVLSPDSANQSAEGAALMREGLVFKTEDRIARAAPSWDALVNIGLRLDGLDATVETQWAPPERQSLAEKADAATKLAQTLPWRRLMTDVLGYDAATVDQMDTERAEDTLNMLLAAPVGPAVAPATQPAVVVDVEDDGDMDNDGA